MHLIKRLSTEDDRCTRLRAVPGVGPVTAAGIVGNAVEFKSARQLAAWVVLTLRQHSTGGKVKNMGISKAGNKKLRTLLIHGGRAVLINPGEKPDRRSRWACQLKETGGINRAAVALAHKNRRTIYTLLKHGTEYDDKHKPKILVRRSA